MCSFPELRCRVIPRPHESAPTVSTVFLQRSYIPTTYPDDRRDVQSFPYGVRLFLSPAHDFLILLKDFRILKASFWGHSPTKSCLDVVSDDSGFNTAAKLGTIMTR